MKKLKFGFCFVLILVFFLGIGCVQKIEEPSSVIVEKAAQKTEINLDYVDTIGNNTYIPMNIYGTPNEHRKLILQILEKFRVESDLDIIYWFPDRNQQAHGSSAYIYGLWIIHRPKIEKK